MMKELKIAVIVPSLANRGPIKVMQTIINESVKLCLPIEFTVVTLSDKEGLHMNCKILQYSNSINFEEYDVVHTNGIKPDFIAFRKRHSIRRHLVTIHNYVFEDLLHTYNRVVSLIFGRLWISIWKRADKLICINQDMTLYYKPWTKTPIGFIHNGISKLHSESIEPVLDSEKDLIDELRSKGKTVLGVVCVLTRIKGVDQILNLLGKREDLALVVIGDGRELLNLKALSNELNIQDRCHFFGFKNNACAYFSFFDVFIMPSRSEGFGLTLLEAASFSIPCVCSDIPTFRELFTEDEVTFFTLEVIESLEIALNKIILNKDKFAKAINNKYLGSFTGEILAKKYFYEYKQLV
ncbi:glycosyltransferase family 1 protein [Chryseotalea sanaruensis]|uniref:Glycosyltransferase family 1 protein n=1 Tax=Chryseotalea sanaruensis TaxID=2482724 RepID=A0A401UC36_9BACT|nr:glycosyltransferase [Chryseotalea sanaruensis]GCC52468.1 glycosyltransferase family 1 protein [Chryseotalea sanaruensis]